MPKAPTADRLLELTDNELYLRLGREVIGSEAVPQSLETLIQRGKDIYASVATHLAAKLCHGKAARFDFADLRDATLVSALTSLIIEGGTFNYSHAAAMYLATLIARLGLQKFCTAYGPAQAPSK